VKAPGFFLPRGKERRKSSFSFFSFFFKEEKSFHLSTLVLLMTSVHDRWCKKMICDKALKEFEMEKQR
jgi:hypothetical protein